MSILVKVAGAMGAAELLDISGAHIDSCLYHGRVGLDFATRLRDGDGRVRVPTTLNVTSLDLLHPELYRGDAATAELTRALVEAYLDMGCTPTWTCSPYQAGARPAAGEHVAWAESNAIVFANSVLAARTHRYGDFIDICAALVGRAPAAGLHLTENRRGQILFDVTRLPATLLESFELYPVLGHAIGALSGRRVPVIEGLPADLGEDQLKALGAAAASSGAVGLFHAVGVTPEAPTRYEAFHGGEPEEIVLVDGPLLASSRAELTTVATETVDAVSLGAPHYSAGELRALVAGFRGRRAVVPCYVNTNRASLQAAQEEGVDHELEAAGVTVVVDTCTYVTPIIDPAVSVVMTDSAKWAYYAPANIGVDVVFGSVAECIESAVAGSVARDREVWDAI